MFLSNQSSFGSLTKSKKKKRKKNKGSKPSSHQINGFHRSSDANLISEPDGKDAFSNLPQEDVRFVLPRQPNSSSSKQIPFLLPGQKQLLIIKDDVNDASLNEGTHHLEVSTTTNVDESIDDIFGHSTKKKSKSKEATVASNLKAGDKETLSEKSKESKKRDSEQKCNEKSKPNSNLKNEGETKNGVIHTEESNDKMILARSVQDAVNDKVGRRPRANSTDGELNLPQHGLCDERSVQLSHKWDLNRLYNCDGSHKVAPPRGLVNLGNTCFLNATLQCLVYMPSFCQSIIDLPPSCYDSKNGGTLRHGQRITMMMRSILRIAHGITQREKNDPPKTNAFAPKSIFKAITSCRINGHRFRAGRQEDAHELLGKYTGAFLLISFCAFAFPQLQYCFITQIVHLLDAMHEGELFAAGINPNMSGWRDKLPIPRLDETTFVHRIFGGYFRSQLKCNKCGYKSNTYDPFLDLALEISKKHIGSLSSAFKEFTRREKLDSDNQWKCSGCKKHVCPTKHLSVFRPPLTLCIHLKRFGFGIDGFHGSNHFFHRSSKGLNMMGSRGSKISKRIEFPAQLSLPLSDGRVCDYTLTGIIVHVGGTATSGHYTSYVKHPGASSKLWYHMDDSFVTEVSEKTVLKQRDAYVLFYTRKEVKLEFPQPPSRERESVAKGAKKEPPLDDKQSTNDEPNRKKPKLIPPPSPGSEPSAMKHLNEANASSSDTSTSDSSSELSDVKKSLKFAPKQMVESPAKPQKQSKQEKTMKGNNVEVILSRGKKRKAWKPPEATKLSSAVDNLLLGNISVGNWDSEEKPNSLRDVAAKEMESKERYRKRKMHLDRWDAAIDEGKTKKVKDKSNQEEVRMNMKQTSDNFQRIQRDMQAMSAGRAKGYRSSKDHEGRVSSFKKKKIKSMQR
eukprot:scaffold10893_cov153-Skeletonema_menzelii.AAC.2